MTIETICVTVTRDELGGRANPDFNEFLASFKLTRILRDKRIPVTGVCSVIAVERGKLTIEHSDGLDGDEWKFTFVGEPIMKEILRDVQRPGYGISLRAPLAPREAVLRRKLAEDDEL